MYLKAKFLIFTLFMNSYAMNAGANDIEKKPTPDKVEVTVDIFALNSELTIKDYSTILEINKPESSPQFTVTAGEHHSIDISNDELNWKSSGITRIKFVTNHNASKFDLEFELVTGEVNNIGSATSIDIGKVMIMSANLDNETKLIRVTTSRHDDSKLNTINSLASKELTNIDNNEDYCGTIVVNKRPKSRHYKKLRFISLNGEDLTSHGGGHRDIARKTKLRVLPGKHVFTATANCMSLNKAQQYTTAVNLESVNWCRASSTKKKRHEKFRGEFSFTLNVEAGKKYLINAVPKILSTTALGNELHANVFKVVDESCSLSDYQDNVKSTRINR